MNPVSITHSLSPVTTRPKLSLFAIVDFLFGLVSTIETWRQSYKARKQFSQIDARTLRDAGISEAQRFMLTEL